MVNQKINIHGLMSLLLFINAFGVALLSIGSESIFAASIFLLLFIAFFIVVAVVYCSKCLCRKNCNHLIIGRLSIFLTKARPGAYTRTDFVLGVILPLLPVIIMPQFYLIGNIIHLLMFWIFFTLSSLEIIFFVCKGCTNSKCPMCKHFKEPIL